jgi:GT2 family glycosyltransferase
MELSVIIVSYNVKDFLERCLDSVRSAVERIECEIFVVDNNSADGSAEMLKRQFPEVKLIANRINSGFSVANNLAIRKSSGQFMLLLNPDTLVEKDTFQKCIDFMNSHPDAGALGVRMINGEGKYIPESKRAFPSAQTAIFKTTGLSHLFPHSPLINRYYLPQINEMETSLTEVISGAFMFLRREALEKSGPLDEDFFMYGEDIDMSFRLIKTGYHNYYFPGARIVHFKGRSTSRNGYTDIRHFYKAMRIYIRKRKADGSYGSFTFLLISASCIGELLALFNRFLRLTFTR